MGSLLYAVLINLLCLALSAVDGRSHRTHTRCSSTRLASAAPDRSDVAKNEVSNKNEPLFNQRYDPLHAPTQVTVERDLEDVLMDRALRFLDPVLLRKKNSEKCYLVGLEDKSKNDHLDDTKFTLEESLTELSELAGAAGMEVVGSTYQRLERPSIEYYVGPGKVKEVAKTMMKLKCTTVVFDTELSPSQQKNLEISFREQISPSMGKGGKASIKVLDRTALILDIFAQHARTREGQLQVQLALMTYRLPRLTNMWSHLERQSAGARGKSNGGVGLRGPGEMQLESDKREMKSKISRLKESIDSVRRTRSSHRKRRRRLGVPVVALVGYTNAGKSTVLNYLTNAGVLVADMLFATLDPTTRIVRLPGIQIPEVLLTDTVGFVQKLPTNLVAAFRATLEEISEADILLHVTDVTNEARRKQEAAVLRELAGMGLEDTPIITIWNKIDMIPKLKEYYKFEAKNRGQTVAFSAVTGEGMDELVKALQTAIFSELDPVELSVLYTEVNIMNILHRIGVVDSAEYLDTHIAVKARVPRYLQAQLEEYFSNKEDNVDMLSESSDSEDNMDPTDGDQEENVAPLSNRVSVRKYTFNKDDLSWRRPTKSRSEDWDSSVNKGQTKQQIKLDGSDYLDIHISDSESSDGIHEENEYDPSLLLDFDNMLEEGRSA